MGKIVALVVALLFGGVANACECAFYPLDSAQARAANNVFVFRLIDARVEDAAHGQASNWVIGGIRVLANVRGKTTAREVRFSTYICCGSRLEVGKYYVGFLSSNTVRFNGNASSILPLWDDFDPEVAEDLESVLRGNKRLEDAFSYGLVEINRVRPPPAPCPGRDKAGR